MLNGYTPVDGYGKILSSPPPFEAGHSAGWFFTLYAGLAAVLLSLPWAYLAWQRRRDTLPLLMLAGGFLTSLGEPMLDLVGHLRWASDAPGPAFSNFGIDIPYLIPPCYAAFMGLEAYFVYAMIKRGVTRSQFFLIMAAIGISDAIMEHPGLILNVYEYYGNQPLKFYEFPFYWSFTNSAAITTIGVMVYYLYPRLQPGWQRLLIIPLGLIGTTMGEFTTGFPVFLSINSGMPTWLMWVIGGGGCIVMTAAYARVMSELVCKKEKVADFSLLDLIRWRLFMTPKQRERLIAEA
jgi:hypothetical protein